LNSVRFADFDEKIRIGLTSAVREIWFRGGGHVLAKIDPDTLKKFNFHGLYRVLHHRDL